MRMQCLLLNHQVSHGCGQVVARSKDSLVTKCQVLTKNLTLKAHGLAINGTPIMMIRFTPKMSLDTLLVAFLLWTGQVLMKFLVFMLSTQRTITAQTQLASQALTVLAVMLLAGIWTNKKTTHILIKIVIFCLCISQFKSLCIQLMYKKYMELKSKQSIAKLSTQVYSLQH